MQGPPDENDFTNSVAIDRIVSYFDAGDNAEHPLALLGRRTFLHAALVREWMAAHESIPA